MSDDWQVEPIRLGAQETPPEALELIEPIIIPGEKRMSIISHLEELRRSLIVSFISVLLATIACFTFNDWLLTWLIQPAHHVEFVFVSPGEAFMASLRAAMMAGLFLALPVILQQFFWFIGPGLTREEKRISIPVVVMAYVLFLAGILFAYFFLLPAGLGFLLGFAPPSIKPMLSIGQYIGFTSTLLLATGGVFELPLILLMLASLRLVRAAQLAVNRRYALLISFVVGAVVTPSVDIVTQSLLAGALFLLFEASIWLIRLLEWRREKHAKEIASDKV